MGVRILEIITYIIAVSLATIIPPFTAVPIELVAAKRYGLFLSLIFTIAGNVSGAIVAFLLARKYGWKLIRKLFSDKKVRKAKEIIKNYSFWHMVWTRIVFASVFDVLSFVCGLTQISLKKYFLATLIANIPSTFIILAFGNKIDLNFVMIVWVTVGIFLISIVLMLKQLIKAVRLEKAKG